MQTSSNIITVNFKNISLRTGLALNKQGIPIIPIIKRTKAPKVKNWPQFAYKEVPPSKIEQWSDDFEDCGWGIACGNKFVGIDIDIEDKEIAQFVTNVAFSLLGRTLKRIGRAPRSMLVYNIKQGVIKSSDIDDVQILGKGKQFVAFGIHPQTNKPYRWLGDNGLCDMVDFSKTLTVDQVKIDTLISFLKKARKNGLFERLKKLTKDTREGLNRPPQKNKRSDHQHWAIIELSKLAFSHDEIFYIIWAHPNGVGQKAHDRGQKWLKDRIASEASTLTPISKQTSKQLKPLSIVIMSDVEEKEVPWVWEPFLARGEITMLEGEPGLGKSYFISAVGKACVDGSPLPNNKTMTKGKILYFATEDDPNYGIKPRLNGLKCKNTQNFIVCEETVWWDETGLERIKLLVENIRPDIIVFDPLMNFVGGKADINKSNSVTSILDPIRLMARQFNCSIVLIRHLVKDASRSAMNAGQGSIVFNSAPRLSLRMARIKGSPHKRLVAHIKNNIGPDDQAIMFSITEAEDIKRKAFKWEGETTGSAAVLVQGLEASVEEDNIDSLLKKLFKDNNGKIKSTILKDKMEAYGYKWVTVTNHLKKLGAKNESNKDKLGKKGYYCWMYPAYTPSKG